MVWVFITSKYPGTHDIGPPTIQFLLWVSSEKAFYTELYYPLPALKCQRGRAAGSPGGCGSRPGQTAALLAARHRAPPGEFSAASPHLVFPIAK